MRTATEYPFTDHAPVRLVTSKDGLRTVAVRMDDALHNLAWGRLTVANMVGAEPAEVLNAEDATAWIVRERAVGQTSSRDRLARLRAAQAPAFEVAA